MEYNVINYLSILVVLFILYKYRKINLALFILFSLSSISPFVAELVYPSSSMADVYIYYYIVDYLRDLNFDYKASIIRLLGPDTIPMTHEGAYTYDPSFHASVILALIPIPFIYSSISLGFSNKLIYILTIVYLKNKNSLHDICLVVFLFFPSLIFYTSVGLKDTLVWSFSCLIIFFFIKKKYIFLLIFITLLLSIKWTNCLVILTFLLFHSLLFLNYSKKIKYFLIISFLIFSILILFLCQDILLGQINRFRIGQWDADRQLIKPETLELNFFIFFELINSLKRFFFSPDFFQVENTTQVFVLFENILIILILLIVIVKSSELNKRRALFWLGFLMAFALIYGITTINFGTLNRWKLSIIPIYIFASLLDCTLNEKKKKNSLYY